MCKKTKFVSLLLTSALLMSTIPSDVWASAKTGSNIALNGYMKELGYHEMGLSSEQVREKKDMKASLGDLDAENEGISYADNRITFMAETKSEASKIAACYNAELVFYSNGIAAALVDFSEESAVKNKGLKYTQKIPTSVYDLVELSMDTSNSLPPIYPSFVYTIDEENETVLGEQAVLCAEEIASASDSADSAILESADEYFPSTVSGNEFINKQWFHKYVNTKYAWENGISGNGIVVAVIDTGIDNKNPDLIDNIHSYQRNICAFDTTLSQYYKDENDASDDQGHGTHCAGIIAGANNTVGGVGMAYQAQIMAFKAMTFNGKGGSEYVSAAIMDASLHGADIISMSLGSTENDPLERMCVENAMKNGSIVVAAAGNAGMTESGSLYDYPSSIDNVLSVGALSPGRLEEEDMYLGLKESKSKNGRTVKKSDEELEEITEIMSSYKPSDGATLGYYSNYNDKVNILAPGTAIYSTYVLKGDADDNGHPEYIESTFDYDTGTSMACPLVAGACALALQASDNINQYSGVGRQIYMNQLIFQSTDEKIYSTSKYGEERSLYGCIDIEKLIDNASSGLAKLEVSKDDIPEIEIDRNRDGSYKAGLNSIIKIGNKESFPSGTRFYYTLDGSIPSANNGIEYQEGKNTLENIKNKATIKMVAVWNGNSSGVGVLKGDFNVVIESIDVGTPEIKLLSAKSASIAINISPSNYNKGKIVYSSNNKNITVNSKGIIKAKAQAKAGDTAVITIKDSFTGKKASAVVEIVSEGSQKIVIPDDIKNGITLYSKNFGIDEEMPKSVDLAGRLISGNSIGANYFAYKVANKKIATVKNGVIYAKAPGKTKITIKTNDGSNKSKTINVKVVCPVTEVDFTTDTGFSLDSYKLGYGTDTIPIGNKKCKVKIKAVVNSDSTNKKIKYTVEEGKEDIIKISKSGVITPGKYAKPGDEVRVTASACDNLGYSKVFYVKVYEPVKSLKLCVSSDNGASSKLVSSWKIMNKTKDDTIKTYNQFTNRYVSDTEIECFSETSGILSMYYEADGSGDNTYMAGMKDDNFLHLTYIKSSNANLIQPKNTIGMAYVKQAKKGKTKLTIMTRDGSNKKINLTVYTTER